MAEFDEFDQEEQVKQWLKQNVPWILGGIIVGLASVFGYRYWDASQQAKTAAASDLYFSVREKISADPLADIEPELAELESDYSGTSYYLFTQLHRAKQQVTQEQYDDALETLQEARSIASAAGFDDLLLTRIARVELLQGKPEQARGTIAQISDGAFNQVKYELEGDSYVMMEDYEAARTAYQESLTALGSSQQAPMLMQKLNVLPESNDGDSERSQSATISVTASDEMN